MSCQLWYPLSKTLAEKAAWDFAKEKGLDVVVVNPGTVMGPILPPTLNASMLIIHRLIQGNIGQTLYCVWFVVHWTETDINRIKNY